MQTAVSAVASGCNITVVCYLVYLRGAGLWQARAYMWVWRSWPQLGPWAAPLVGGSGVMKLNAIAIT